MSAQHTPGPWECNVDDTGIMDCHIGYASIDDGRKEIARVRLDRTDGRDNARLLAAAPELLAALEHILGGALSLPRFAEEQARAAIAKAKGDPR